MQDNGFATLKEVENTILYSYNSEGQLTKKTIIKATGESTVIHIVNTEGNSAVKFKVDGRDITSHSKTDTLGRKVFDELQLSAGTLSRQFLYCKGETYAEYDDNYSIKSAATTQLVRQMILSNTNLGYDERIISYEYDDEERITKVIDSVDGTTEYTYDALGQLLTETVTKDGVTDVVNTMTYDNYGNILTKNGKVYTYGDSAWKDKLTAFDGQAITYDAQGNPLSYLGHTLTWEKGRQLKSFDGNSYTYNANGIRTSKTVDGKRHTYTLDGTKILRETWSEDNIPRVIVPMYDNEDSVCGIIYNNRPFYFIKNLQGDVIAIIDDVANIVARYSYDAWGVPTIVQDTTINAVYSNGTESFGYTFDIAEINPYRYRGYYYDSEIGLYHLQSRYYNPITGRFINADVPEIVVLRGRYSLVVDLYAYCKNDCINHIDSIGFFGTPIQWVCAAIGAIAGWVFGDYVATSIGLFDGKWWQWETYAYWTVRTLVVAGGAILGYVAGTKLLNIITRFIYNKGIQYQLPKIVQWFLGISNGGQLANDLYSKYASHIFSSDHVKNGIRKIGSNDRQIFDRIFKVMQSCMPQIQNGSNQIHTYINGYKVTIRFYFYDGTIRSIDAFRGWATRIIGHLIKKW